MSATENQIWRRRVEKTRTRQPRISTLHENEADHHHLTSSIPTYVRLLPNPIVIFTAKNTSGPEVFRNMKLIKLVELPVQQNDEGQIEQS